jgi:hypothetical protein
MTLLMLDKKGQSILEVLVVIYIAPDKRTVGGRGGSRGGGEGGGTHT